MVPGSDRPADLIDEAEDGGDATLRSLRRLKSPVDWRRSLNVPLADMGGSTVCLGKLRDGRLLSPTWKANGGEG